MKPMQAASSVFLKLLQALLNLIKRTTLKAAKCSRCLWLALRALLSITHPRTDNPTTPGQLGNSILYSSSPSKNDLPNQSASAEGLAPALHTRYKLADVVENVLNTGQHQLSLDVNQESVILTGLDRTNQAYRLERDHVEATIVPAGSSLQSNGQSLAPAPDVVVVPSNTTNIIGSIYTVGNADEKISLKTALPSALKRYDRNITVPEKNRNWEIAGLLDSKKFQRRGPLGTQWISCTHPEGILYHRGAIDGIIFYTDVDVSDTSLYFEVHKVIKKLQGEIEKKRQSLSSQLVTFSEVVLEKSEDKDNPENEKGITWEYYFVDHNSQHLFWLDEHKLETFIYKGAESKAHIGRLLKCEYYMHLSFFPHKRKLEDGFFTDLKGMLVWGLADSMTSLDSLAPYDVKTMERFLKLINHLQDLNESAPEYCVAAGARLRFVFETSRFDNFSGFPCARLSRSQSVRGEGRQDPSLVFRFASLFFLQVPAKYLKLLDGVYVDKIVFQVPFRIFVKGVSDGWQQDVINAAVLFTANIAFLAIPNLLPDSGINGAATASVVSIILSLSSIIFGQLLSKKIQAVQEESTGSVALYFGEWWSTKSGLSELAVMYSLPYALMIWGVIAFILAIFLFTFRNFELNVQSIIVIAFLSTSIILCIWIVFGNSIMNYPRKLLTRLGILADEDEAGKSLPNVIAPRDMNLGTIVKVLSRWKQLSMRGRGGPGEERGTEQSQSPDRTGTQSSDLPSMA